MIFALAPKRAFLTFVAALSVTMIVNVKKIYAGGKDGGGGNVVITLDGNLRFLDQALGSRVPLRAFSPSDLTRVYGPQTSDKSWSIVTNPSFFACANQKFAAQVQNPFLRYIGRHNFGLVTVLTDQPVDSVTRSQLQLGFSNAGEVAFAQEALRSPSLPRNYQVPLAAFFNVGFNEIREGLISVSNLLVVNRKLYRQLSAEDRCAAQIHERLRYLVSLRTMTGQRLLKRRLSTADIENLTRRIMSRLPVGEAEIQFNESFEAAISGDMRAPIELYGQSTSGIRSGDIAARPMDQYAYGTGEDLFERRDYDESEKMFSSEELRRLLMRRFGIESSK